MKRFTSDILIFSLNSQRRIVEGFEESGKQTNKKSTEAQGVQMYSKAPPSHSQELITLILDSFYLLLPSEELSKTQYLFSHTCLQFWQTTSKILFVSYSLHVVFQLSSLASIPILIFLGMLPCNLLYKLHTKSEKKRVQKSNWVLTMWLLGKSNPEFPLWICRTPPVTGNKSTSPTNTCKIVNRWDTPVLYQQGHLVLLLKHSTCTSVELLTAF